jgi:hypothetical protein
MNVYLFTMLVSYLNEQNLHIQNTTYHRNMFKISTTNNACGDYTKKYIRHETTFCSKYNI